MIFKNLLGKKSSRSRQLSARRRRGALRTELLEARQMLAADYLFDLPAGVTSAILEDADPTDTIAPGMMQIRSPSGDFATEIFESPTNLLTIRGGDGADSLIVRSRDGSFLGSLQIEGEALGTSSVDVTFDTAIDFEGNLDVSATDINVNESLTLHSGSLSMQASGALSASEDSAIDVNLGTVDFSSAHPAYLQSYVIAPGYITLNSGEFVGTGIASLENGDVLVKSGATLSGDFFIGSTVIVESGGIVSPGIPGSAGFLTVDNLVMQPGSQMEIEIDSFDDGDFDQVEVFNGFGVDLSGGILDLSFGGETPQPGTYPIVRINPEQFLTGFAGLPDGTAFSVDGIDVQIDYSADSVFGETLVELTVFEPLTVVSIDPVLDADAVAEGTDQLVVEFNRDPPSDLGTSPARLQSVGPDGLLGTADDESVMIDSATYAGTLVTLDFPPLSEDVYRLTIGPDAVLANYQEQIDAQRAAVATAQANLDAANLALTDANAAVAAKQAELDFAQQNVFFAEDQRNHAQFAVDEAFFAFQEAEMAYFGKELELQEAIDNDADEFEINQLQAELASLQVDLDVANAQLSEANAMYVNAESNFFEQLAIRDITQSELVDAQDQQFFATLQRNDASHELGEASAALQGIITEFDQLIATGSVNAAAFDGDGDGQGGDSFTTDFVVTNDTTTLLSVFGNDYQVQTGGSGAGQLTFGTDQSFDGSNRMQIDGNNVSFVTETVDAPVPSTTLQSSGVNQFLSSNWTTLSPSLSNSFTLQDTRSVELDASFEAFNAGGFAAIDARFVIDGVTQEARRYGIDPTGYASVNLRQFVELGPGTHTVFVQVKERNGDVRIDGLSAETGVIARSLRVIPRLVDSIEVTEVTHRSPVSQQFVGDNWIPVLASSAPLSTTFEVTETSIVELDASLHAFSGNTHSQLDLRFVVNGDTGTPQRFGIDRSGYSSANLREFRTLEPGTYTVTVEGTRRSGDVRIDGLVSETGFVGMTLRAVSQPATQLSVFETMSDSPTSEQFLSGSWQDVRERSGQPLSTTFELDTESLLDLQTALHAFSSNIFSQFDMRFVVNGAVLPSQRYGIDQLGYSFARMRRDLQLPAGTHTVTLQAKERNGDVRIDALSTSSGVTAQTLRAVATPTAIASPLLEDDGETIVVQAELVMIDGVASELIVSREITVSQLQSDEFVRTVEVLENPSAAEITTTVRIVGNLGSDQSTVVFNTSDGDQEVEVTDQWIGTDDEDNDGTPALIHYVHGPGGLMPSDVEVVGDNIAWTYDVTIPAGETVRLASFTIQDPSRAYAESVAADLITDLGFREDAELFLSQPEIDSISNFVFTAADDVNASMPLIMQLRDASNQPLVGNHVIGYQLFDAAVEGNLIVSLSGHDVDVTGIPGGFYEVDLARDYGVTDFPTEGVFLQVTVDGVPSAQRIELNGELVTTTAGDVTIANAFLSLGTRNIEDTTWALRLLGNLRWLDDEALIGVVDWQATLFDSTTNGTSLFTESGTISLYDSIGGSFGIALGENTPLDLSILSDNPDVWVELTINGESFPERLKVDGGGLSADSSSYRVNSLHAVRSFDLVESRDYEADTLSIAGLLIDGETSQPITGEHTFEFVLYDYFEGTTVFAETATIDVTDSIYGSFVHALGSVNPLDFDLLKSPDLVLEVTVDGRDLAEAPLINTAMNFVLVDVDLSPASVLQSFPSFDGGTAEEGISIVDLEFSSPLDESAVVDAELSGLGPDGLLGTMDDEVIEVFPFVFGNYLTLDFAGLAQGVYRLTLNDSLTDVYGDAIDGDGDGVAGGELTVDFVVLPASDQTLLSPVIVDSSITEAGQVVAADLNFDGYADFVTAQYSDNLIVVGYGDGEGGFTKQSFASVGSGPTSIAVADFDNDGAEDIVVGERNSSSFQVYLNDGFGAFTAGATVSGGYSFSREVAVADLNDDGNVDLVMNYDFGPGGNDVHVVFGNGDGTFDTGYDLMITDGSLQGIRPLDWNGDGHTDFAYTPFANGSEVRFLINDGTGILAESSTTLSTGNFVGSVAVGDFNFDGVDDVAVAKSGVASGNVLVFLGDGVGGVLETKTLTSTVSSASQTVTGDFTGDGILDLAVAHTGSGDRISILAGDGTGEFALDHVVQPSEGDIYLGFDALAVEDFNLDGASDLLISAYLPGAIIGLFSGPEPQTASLTSPDGFTFDPQLAGDFVGQLVQGTGNAFDGLNRLQWIDDDALYYWYEDVDADGYGAPSAPVIAAFPPDNHVANSADCDDADAAIHPDATEVIDGADNNCDGQFDESVSNPVFVRSEAEPVVPFEFMPSDPSVLDDGNQTVLTGIHGFPDLDIRREITAPGAGNENFVRTIEVLENTTGQEVSGTIRVIGNLGSDSATTIFNTSNGDTTLDVTDQWFGTDDADGSGSPAIIHYVHGPSGLPPSAIEVLGDNVFWTFDVTVPAGQTLRLASFTIVGDTRDEVEAAAAALVTSEGLGAEAGAFLSQAEIDSIANFRFNSAPVAVDDLIITDEDTSVEFNVLADNGNGVDIDPDGTIVASLTTANDPPLGILTDLGDGDFRFDPAGAFENLLPGSFAPVTFSYQIVDNEGETATGFVEINVFGANDIAIIGGENTGDTDEDTTELVTGTLTVSDLDAGQSQLVAQLGVLGSYGEFNVGESGDWNYLIDPSKTQALVPDMIYTDVFTVSSVDGSATETVTITVAGLDDPATIGGDLSATTDEDATEAVTGSLTIDDPDAGDGFVVAQDDMPGVYGTFSVDASGSWTYAVDNATAQSLNGETDFDETFEVQSIDGSDITTVTITVEGLNDPAMISGLAAGSTDEDSTTAVTGSLSVTDADTAEAEFVPQTSMLGLYGSFSIDGAGQWSYVLHNASVQDLPAGTPTTDSFGVSSLDLSAIETVVITIVGNNDLAEISGDLEGLTDEDATELVTGSITVTDDDTGENGMISQESTPGDYGTFSIDANGDWTYSLNTASVQYLVAEDSVNDTFAVSSIDGSAIENVIVTIAGLNDPATIEGDLRGPTNEDATAEVTGSLTVTDIDEDESFAQAQTDTPGIYGSFSITAAGQWTYILDPASVQELNAGVTVSDEFEVLSLDGSAMETVVIDIEGLNDTASITGDLTGSTDEDAANPVMGALSVEDEDSGEAFVIGYTIAGDYGSFDFDPSGDWFYIIDPLAADALVAGQLVSESFDVTSLDALTTVAVVIEIEGRNDIPTITGVTDGMVVENESEIAEGDLNIVDLDSGESLFIAQEPIPSEYGTFRVNETGFWRFVLDSDSVDHLGEGEILETGFTVESLDGTTSEIVGISIEGRNDVPTIDAISVTDGVAETTSEADPVVLDVAFTDLDLTDSHTVFVAWGETPDLFEPVTIDPLARNFQASYLYAEPGIYEISVLIEDPNAEVAFAETVAVATGIETFIVNTTADAVDVTIGDGVAVDAMGRTTLRAALQEVNASEDYVEHVILFNLPAGELDLVSSRFVITPTVQLPAITQKVSILGGSQLGSEVIPSIEISGALIPGIYADGLKIRTDDVFVDALAISGFPRDGIDVQGVSGVEITNSELAFNGQNGIYLTDTTEVTVRANESFGNGTSGVRISGSNSSGNTIVNNRLGVKQLVGPGISQAIGNSLYGVYVGSPANVIEDNTISGNDRSGIVISGSTATGNEVYGNYVGTDSSGIAGVGNGGFGIYLGQASGNVIGGPGEGQGNVIADNGNSGIFLTEATGTTIGHNLVGLNALGTASLGNAKHGVHLQSKSSGNLIHDNVITSNVASQIFVFGELSSDNTITGNRIGFTADGSGVLQGGQRAILLKASGNTLGGVTESDANWITGSTTGISLGTEDARDNLVLGNFIGRSPDVDDPMFGMAVGVEFYGGATDNQIGPGNVIANHWRTAVRAYGDSVGNRITENSMPGNYNGIDLGPSGLDPNDLGDVDEGPNRLQNSISPLSDATLTDFGDGVTQLEMTYTVETSLAVAAFPMQVELFTADAGGDGIEYLGSVEYSQADFETGGAQVSLSINTAGLQYELKYLTATVTDAEGNTSEFAARIDVIGVIGFASASLNAAPLAASHPMDLNRDSFISAIDALHVINRLTQVRAEGESSAAARSDRHDVNRDGRVSALDALLIINHLSNGRNQIAVATYQDTVDDVFTKLEDDEASILDELLATELF